MNTQLEEIAKIWPGIQNIFSVPHNQKEYNRLVHILDGLIDEVGENESDPLASLMETLGSLIESYEVQNIPEIEGNPNDTLKTLMKEHDLKQSDLSEIGSQGVISEILSGKRQLNIRQIKLLSKRFNVSPAVFM
ncbi:MAG: helix-turn-helix domain-containing protein [Deltaproteobacteria bacterium]|nr:helix-turn-helix domain-containing protein [Deltaproteobacteria bacterium]